MFPIVWLLSGLNHTRPVWSQLEMLPMPVSPVSLYPASLSAPSVWHGREKQTINSELSWPFPYAYAHTSNLRLLVWCDHLRPVQTQLLAPITLCKNMSKQGTWASQSLVSRRAALSQVTNFAAFMMEFELIFLNFPYQMASLLVPDLFEMQVKSILHQDNGSLAS